jgi:outer membrane biosynthesis protein TonB
MKWFLILGFLLLVSPAAVVPGAAAPESGEACVKLVRSEPFPPDESALPAYPEAAKSAHVEGDVSLHFDVGSGCATEEITVDDGPEILREPVAVAAKNWKYCGVPEGQEIHATVAFRLSCPAR